jgi:hypothetical protein
MPAARESSTIIRALALTSAMSSLVFFVVSMWRSAMMKKLS